MGVSGIKKKVLIIKNLIVNEDEDMTKEPDRAINEWMKGFQTLYGEADKNRSPEQIWIATMAHCSATGEAIRRFNFADLIDSMAHSFCWICSFVNKCNILPKDNVFSYEGCLSDMVSAKYPGVCGHCKGDPCICKPKDMDSKKDKAGKYRWLYDNKKRTFKHEKQKISDWLKIFDRLYDQQIHVQSFESIGFHFLEEAGECAKAIRALGQLVDSPNQINDIDSKFTRQLIKYEDLLNQYEIYDKKAQIPKPTDKTFTAFSMSDNSESIKSRIVHAKMDMIIEIADTFSWFCSIINKAKTIAKNTCDDPISLNLENKLKEIYLDDKNIFICPNCKKKKCECAFLLPKDQ